MKDDRFDLEGELHASRSRPRADFASALAGEVRGATRSARQSRNGLMLALAGLVIVAVASFGGVGYAASPSGVAKPSAAQGQYGTFTPPKAKKAVIKPAVKPAVKPKVKKVVKREPVAQVAGKTQSANVAPKVKSGQLPFTGLALWVPLASGLVLIALGLVLRTRGRRHSTGAH
jgi:hypothetical protein